MRRSRRTNTRHARSRYLKLLGKWLGGLVVGIAVIVLILGILVPYSFGGKWLRVMSGSMMPVLEPNGLVLTWPVDTDSIKTGDIIVYHPSTDSDAIVAHRVIEVINGESLSFQTKGDANEEPDGYTVGADEIVGEVHFHIAGLGRTVDNMRDFVTGSFGFMLLLGLPGALIIAIEIRNMYFSFDRQKRREQRWKEMEKKRMKRRERTRKSWDSLWETAGLR